MIMNERVMWLRATRTAMVFFWLQRKVEPTPRVIHFENGAFRVPRTEKWYWIRDAVAKVFHALAYACSEIGYTTEERDGRHGAL